MCFVREFVRELGPKAPKKVQVEEGRAQCKLAVCWYGLY